MKKFFIGISLMVIALLVSGCGAKGTQILECSMTDDETEGMSLTDTVKATYTNDELQEIVLNYEITFTEEYADYIDVFASSFKEEFTYLENQKGITLTNDINENVFKFNIAADLTKMDDEAKEALDIVEDNSTYESTKAGLEEEGYTCK